jgi:hypothetical protein
VLPLPNEIEAGLKVRRLNAQEQKRIVLGRAEKVLLGEAFGLKRTWSVRTEKLVQDWEKLSAKKEAVGVLPQEEKKALDELTDQMKFVFEDGQE